MADEKVMMAQKWINATYKQEIPEDGKTGWTTIYALIRSLQKELGIVPQIDAFGKETSTRYENQIGTLKLGNSSNVVGIMQCAMWCKGYSANYDAITTEYDSAMQKSITSLCSDAGYDSKFSGIDLTLAKALLSMDQFKLITTSQLADKNIRVAQQTLNRKYIKYTGLRPCDGIYGRNTNKAVILALQCLMGMSVEDATGNFGPTTKNSLPDIDSGNAKEKSEFLFLFKLALYANLNKTDRSNLSIDYNFNSTLESKIRIFQKFAKLKETGKINTETWCSVLISCGDKDRKTTGCDRAKPFSDSEIQALSAEGYKYVGRYLTGTYGGIYPKAMTRDEASKLLKAGLRIFPIYQDGGRKESEYTISNGQDHADRALKAAIKLGIPKGTIIYFAVDFDALDYQIESNVIPYFKEISRILKSYKVGIYGTRNVCTEVIKANGAVSAFLSDMSYGWSGNLGFPMTEKWAFDQIATIDFQGDELDKVIVRGDGYSGDENSKPDIGFSELTDVVFEDEFDGSEGPYRIYSEMLSDKKENRKNYHLAVTEPEEGNVIVRNGLPVRITDKGYGNREIFYIKKSPFQTGAYVVSPAINNKDSEKQYVLDRYVGVPNYNMADIYVQSEADKTCQDVYLYKMDNDTYTIGLAPKNAMMLSCVVDEYNEYWDADKNLIWKNIKNSPTDPITRGETWRFEKAEVIKQDDHLCGLKLGEIYTISVGNSYLGVKSGKEVYAGAPVTLIENYTDLKSVQWKLIQVNPTILSYSFAPVYNEKLSMNYVSGEKYGLDEIIVVDDKPNKSGFGFEIDGSGFQIMKPNTMESLYLSVATNNYEIAYLDHSGEKPKPWSILQGTSESGGGSQDSGGRNAVNWSQKFTSPPSECGDDYYKVKGLDGDGKNVAVHPGSGFLTGDLQYNKFSELQEILANFYKKVFKVDSAIAGKYDYFVYGEWGSLGFHQGVDMNYNQGGAQPIYSAHAGKVTRVGGTYGQIVIQEDNSPVKFCYAHMSDLKFAVGDTVKIGDQLGIQSNVGVDAIHLHFEVILAKNTGIQNYISDSIYPMNSIRPYGYM